MLSQEDRDMHFIVYMLGDEVRYWIY